MYHCRNLLEEINQQVVKTLLDHSLMNWEAMVVLAKKVKHFPVLKKSLNCYVADVSSGRWRKVWVRDESSGKGANLADTQVTFTFSSSFSFTVQNNHLFRISIAIKSKRHPQAMITAANFLDKLKVFLVIILLLKFLWSHFEHETNIILEIR